MIDLKTQNPDHLLACVAYCGKIDRIAYKFEKTIPVNEKLLRVNAGFREGLESGSRDETIAKGTLESIIVSKENIWFSGTSIGTRSATP